MTETAFCMYIPTAEETVVFLWLLSLINLQVTIAKPRTCWSLCPGLHRQVSLSSAGLQTHNAGCAPQESCDCASAHRTHSAP